MIASKRASSSANEVSIRHLMSSSCGPDLAAHLDAAAVRQAHVQHGHVRAGGRDPDQRLGRRTGLADHLDVVLDREQFVDAPADHFVVIEEEYGDFSVFAHGVSLTHQALPVTLPGRGGRDNVPVFRPPARL